MSDTKSEDRQWRICDLPDGDKPRERAMRSGIASLSDSELLAIIMGSGMRGKSVVELSREILTSFDNKLDRLALATIGHLSTKFKGVGEAKAISLAASIELGRRCQTAIDDRSRFNLKITGSRTVFELMRHRMTNNTQEEFWVIHLNRANVVIEEQKVSLGSTCATVVDVKVILKEALSILSESLILVHNHPSGNLNPSPQDDNLTRKIFEAAKMLDIRVVDHLIIGSGGYYSYNDEGRMAK